jgi:hypothetical protein
MVSKPSPLPPIPTVNTIDEVVDAIQLIVDWSIATASRLGYFAALYKRITVAVRTAITDGTFQDGPRMQRLDVTFARRYFAALNGRFHPGQFARPTHVWQVTFDGAKAPGPIILQHMLAGINAHIALDLGFAAEATEPGPALTSLHDDFNTINNVLASQIDGVLDAIERVSPVVADLRRVLSDNEIGIVNEVIKFCRDDAWSFATILAREPEFAKPRRSGNATSQSPSWVSRSSIRPR